MKSVRTILGRLLAVAGGGLIIAALGFSAGSVTQRHNEALKMSWDGEDFSSSVSESFFGTPTVVPGDTIRRTLFVRNDGPSDAMLQAKITNVNLTHDRSDTFYDQLLVDWETGQTTMRQLAANGETTIVDMRLAQGAETDLTIGYHLPYEASETHSNNDEHRLAGFDVELELVGITTGE